jgi:tRNA threonylcarbamoyladenosine biosynthesis protein TsaE
MPILSETSLEFLSHSPEQSIRYGVRLGELIQPGDLICMAGDLGSGKTTLAQGIARGWGSFDQVTSPTFVLLNEYRRADSSRFYHFDGFRIQTVEEAIAIGMIEILDDRNPLMVEWPERIVEILPQRRLWINLRWIDDLRRGLQMEAVGPRYERLLREYRSMVFGG